MRRKLLLAGVLAVSGGWTTGPLASAAMPMFHNSGAASTPSPTIAPAAKSGWGMPSFKVGSLWGNKNPEPQYLYQAQASQPSATQRVANAVTDNAVVNTARGWVAPKETVAPWQSAAPKTDSLSISESIKNPTPSLYVSMAQVRESQNDPEGARRLYQQALAAGPEDVKTLREVGHFEDRQNRLADAERFYSQAATIAPQDSATLNDLALCLARQGKLHPSVEVLHRAVRIEPGKALYRNNIATVLMEMGEQHEAMTHLMAAHKPAAAFYNMGHLLEKGNQTEAAAAHYAEAARLDPSMTAAASAVARLSPTVVQQQAAPQTAMRPQPQSSWTPTAAPTPAPQQPTHEPNFGPQLLPPVE